MLDLLGKVDGVRIKALLDGKGTYVCINWVGGLQDRCPVCVGCA